MQISKSKPKKISILCTFKVGLANRKSTKRYICGMSSNLTNYLSPQVCGFAICKLIYVLWSLEREIGDGEIGEGGCE
jgi:hypothetical protein